MNIIVHQALDIILIKTFYCHYRCDDLEQLFNSHDAHDGSASEEHKTFYRRSRYCIKITTSIVTFTIVLISACISKGALFFMIAQIARPGNLTRLESTDRPLEYCAANVNSNESRSNTTYFVEFVETEQIGWLW